MSSIANLSIPKKLISAFAILIVIMVSVSGVAYQKLSFIETSNGWATHTYEVLETLEQMVQGMVNQETGVRGYLVSADSNFLAPYKSGAEQYDTAFAHVKQLTSDNPAQQARLDDANRLAATWRTDIAAKEIQLMGNPETQAEARRLEASGAGKTSMDGFRAKVAEIGKIERDLLVTRTSAQNDAFRTSYFTTIAGGTLSLVLAALICWLLARGIATPIVQMTGAMAQLAKGDVSIEIPARNRRDEVGQMAIAVQVFKDNMIRTKELEDQAAEQKKHAEAEKKAAMNKLADEFEASVKGIVQTVSSASTELQTTATSMSSTAEEATRQATAVSAASEQASSNVQTVASAAEELSSSIAEIGRQVAESARIAAKAVEDAGRTNAQVQTLADAAQKIGDVVKLINDIAGQTNLLALNATIEAARAGEAGKGFAVVASEVKSLASQTAKATDEIAAQIKEIQGATTDSVESIKGITGTIGRINEIATTIASAVEEQGAATKEIARNVQQASAGTTEVSSNIAGVTQAATQTGAASTQVLGAAGELAKNAEILRGQVDGFIAKVRTA